MVLVPRYNKNFYLMLEYVSRMLESGAEHWFPDEDAPGMVKPPAGDPFHRPLCVAIYTSLIGGVPTQHTIRPMCGKSWCVNPMHQEVAYSGRPGGYRDLRGDVEPFLIRFPIIRVSGLPK